MTPQEKPAKWARIEAATRLGEAYSSYYDLLGGPTYPLCPSTWLVDLVARLIEKTESPPVDLDEVVVNEILSAFHNNTRTVADRKKGRYHRFDRAVETYKKLKGKADAS